MKNKIIKTLNKKPHPGGRFHFHWMIKSAGEKAYKQSQLCGQEWKTPWILGQAQCLAEYENRIYSRVNKGIEQLGDKVASETKEFETLGKISGIPENLNPESRERLASKRRKMEIRKSEILIHLSQMEMDLDCIDTALQHHLQRAKYITMNRISVYWAGVLKAAASTEMPAEPKFEFSDISEGKRIYERHFQNIKDRLHCVLNHEWQNEEV